MIPHVEKSIIEFQSDLCKLWFPAQFLDEIALQILHNAKGRVFVGFEVAARKNMSSLSTLFGCYQRLMGSDKDAIISTPAITSKPGLRFHLEKLSLRSLLVSSSIMPIISTKCPKCQKVATFPESKAGEVETCSCGQKFRVPKAAASSSTNEAEKKGEKKAEPKGEKKAEPKGEKKAEPKADKKDQPKAEEKSQAKPQQQKKAEETTKAKVETKADEKNKPDAEKKVTSATKEEGKGTSSGKIKAVCPKCKKRHSLDESKAGEVETCSCGQKFRVPKAAASSATNEAEKKDGATAEKKAKKKDGATAEKKAEPKADKKDQPKSEEKSQAKPQQQKKAEETTKAKVETKADEKNKPDAEKKVTSATKEEGKGTSSGKLKAVCPKCKKQHSLDESKAGEVETCSCGQKFRVPKAVVAKSTTEETKQTVTKSKEKSDSKTTEKTKSSGKKLVASKESTKSKAAQSKDKGDQKASAIASSTSKETTKDEAEEWDDWDSMGDGDSAKESKPDAKKKSEETATVSADSPFPKIKTKKKRPKSRRKKKTSPVVLAIGGLLLLGVVGLGAKYMLSGDNDKKENGTKTDNQVAKNDTNDTKEESNPKDSTAKSDSNNATIASNSSSSTSLTNIRMQTEKVTPLPKVETKWGELVEPRTGKTGIKPGTIPKLLMHSSNTRVILPESPSPLVILKKTPFAQSDIQVFNLASSQVLAKISGVSLVDDTLRLDPNKKRLVAVLTRPAELKVWSAQDGKELNSNELSGRYAWIGFAGPDAIAILHRNKKEGRVWNHVKDEDQATFTFPDKIRAIGKDQILTTAGGKALIVPFVSIAPKRLEIYSTITGERLGYLPIPKQDPAVERCLSLTIADDGKELIGLFTAPENPNDIHHLIAWDLSTGTIQHHHKYISEPAPKGKTDLSRYLGPTIIPLGEKVGWLYRGKVLIEPTSGKFSHYLNVKGSGTYGPFIQVNQSQWLMVQPGADNPKRLESGFVEFKFPLEDIRGDTASIQEADGPGKHDALLLK